MLIGSPGVALSGVRDGLQTAQSSKRKSSMVEDAILVRDIGKFPDNSATAPCSA